jgi:hypothetical protein
MKFSSKSYGAQLVCPGETGMGKIQDIESWDPVLLAEREQSVIQEIKRYTGDHRQATMIFNAIRDGKVPYIIYTGETNETD